jgi:cell division protein FtsZ
MQKKRASMHDGPLADLFRQTDASREAAPEPVLEPEPDVAARAHPPKASKSLRAVIEDVAEAKPSRSMPLSPGAESAAYLAVIRVVGVGGAGVNAVNRMIESEIRGVEFLAVNTDAQQLALADAAVKIHIGQKITEGLGSGSDPEVGRRAAEESDAEIREALRGSDLVFVAAGEGGGTGTGAAPVVARIARELGALTVGIVTTPFGFEGARRSAQADDGITKLGRSVDTLVTIPNDRLLTVLDRRTSMVDAFKVADDILRQGVQGICDLITTPGLINLDFADVRTIMRDAGSALMGIGMASGPSRGREAARRAVTSPLVGHGIQGATGILLSVVGGDSLGLHEAMEIAEVVREAAHHDANIIFGATVDERLGDQVWVTVIATGFDRGQATSEANVENRSPEATIDELAIPSTPRFQLDDSGEFELPDFLR